MIEFLTSEYVIHLLIIIGIYLILAQALNINFGMGRLFNLAHIAAYALGAYATALLSTESGAGFFTCVVASALLSGFFAILLGGIALRLKHDYFAIGTLAFHSVVIALLINWKSLTHGVLGIPGIPRPEISGIDFYNNTNFLWLTYIFVLISQLFLYLIFRNSYSRKLRSQAEFEEAAVALGHSARLARNISFFIASSLAGVAGALFAYYLNYIDPTSFGLTEVVFVLTIVVVGRPGSFWGVIGATFFLVLLPEPLRFTGEVQGWFEGLFGMESGTAVELYVLGPIFWVLDWMSQPSVLGPMRQFLYGFILYAMVYLNRAKLFPVQREV